VVSTREKRGGASGAALAVEPGRPRRGWLWLRALAITWVAGLWACGGAAMSPATLAPPEAPGVTPEVAPSPEAAAPLLSALDKRHIRRMVQRHHAMFRRCYLLGLARRPTLSGSLEVSWWVRPDGTVHEVRIAVSDLNDLTVENCIIDGIGQWAFARHQGPPVAVRYPLVFILR